MNIPIRLVLLTRWPAEPYGVTAYYDQMCNRFTHVGVDIGMVHLVHGMG